MSRGKNWNGYGKGWDKLRKSIYERDNYTCQRCGYHPKMEDRSVPIQAHHIIPKSKGGSDNKSNLITLCRSCHGVQHPNNSTFDDDRPDAPIFPYEHAHEKVNSFPKGVRNNCGRCGHYYSMDELVSIPAQLIPDNDIDYGLPVCKPCGGIICDNNPNINIDDLGCKGETSKKETIGQMNKSHPYPTYSTDEIASESREPVNRVEKWLLSSIMRKYSTGILFVILFFAIHWVFGPMIFEIYESSSTIWPVVYSWLLASVIAPTIRWIGSTSLFRILVKLDTKYEESHYIPSFKNIPNRLFVSIFLCMILSIYYTIIIMIGIFVLTLIISLISFVL